ncbi:MAG: shikimate kinase [Phycisphaerales bacterium]
MAPPPRPHIVLMGLRGSGKTTLARLLSNRLNRRAFDLDHLLALRCEAANVGAAFTAQGEKAFREVEATLLGEQLALPPPPRILALGGGTPTAPGAAEALRKAAASGTHIVYLRATAATLRARLERTDLTTRPSLTGKGVLAEIDAVFAKRDALYRSLATRVIETDAMSEDEVLEAIESGLAK